MTALLKIYTHASKIYRYKTTKVDHFYDWYKTVLYDVLKFEIRSRKIILFFIPRLTEVNTTTILTGMNYNLTLE